MKRIMAAFKKHQAILLLFTALFVGLSLLYYFLNVIGKVPKSSYTEFNDMTIDVKHKDGTIEHFNSHLFNFTSCDDVITIHLPLDKSLEKPHQSVNFFFYNSVVKAYYKDKLLISYGEGITRHMIGHLKVSIPIPQEAYGDEITIVIYPTLDILEDTFKPPVLMPEIVSTFFPIIGLEVFYSVFIVILVFSFLGIVIFGFLYHSVDIAKEGTWLMALIFAITLWFLGNSGMLYSFTASEDINAAGEYVGMFLLFTAAPLYSSFETERPMLKRYLKISGWILFGVFVLSCVLYLLPTGFNFVWHLRKWQALQIVMVFSSLMSLLFPGKKRKSVSDHVMGYGLGGVALFGILEQIRIIISAQITENWAPIFQWFTKAHFAIMLILLLVITLFSSYIIKIKYILQKSMREKHLEILAYTDNLTNLGNRQYLQKKLNSLDATHEKDYAIIFVDINGLKYANDNYGHEAGDQLIKMVAFSIKDAMESNAEGFSGRNGGDEFICTVIPAGRVTSIANSIKENLAIAKEIENPPFPVSISIGVANYREVVAGTSLLNKHSINSSHVIKLADERMYEDKCIYKKNRKL